MNAIANTVRDWALRAGRLLLLVALLLVAARLHAADRYVARNGQTPAPPYDSWETAAHDIQDAVAASSAGDTIWLGPGIYTAPASPVLHEGSNVVCIDKLLTLKSASGNPLDTIIDGEGEHRGIAVKHIGNSADTFVLEGITIRNGSATDGGGLYLDSGNWAWAAEVRDCIIMGNTASGDGGGIGMRPVSSRSFTLLIENCRILGNEASQVDGMGGGVMASTGSGGVTLRDTRFEGNSAFIGGGLRMAKGANLVENCRFTHNHAVSMGGGISTTGADQLRNLLVANNQTDQSGSRSKGGGGIAFTPTNQTAEMTNCTLAQNTPSGLLVQPQGGTLTISNSIIHADSGTNVVEYGYTANPPTVIYQTTCSTPVLTGTGNFAADPEWEGHDYYLSPASPCIGAGSAAAWMTGAVDLDGNDRVNGTVDLGAYEYHTPALLASGGVAHAEIVTAANPPRMVTWAANELQEYLFKITGATVPIVTTPTPGVVHLYVGRSAETDRLMLDTGGLISGAFHLRSGRNWMVFLGQDDEFVSPRPNDEAWNLSVSEAEEDAWDLYTGYTWLHPLRFVHRDYNRPNDVWVHDKRGSLNAVHEYLRSLGVRWYLPGEIGEVVPQIATLTVPRVEREVHPDFVVRNMRFSLNRFFAASLDELKWQMRLGLNDGAETKGLGAQGHGIGMITARPETHAAHPEYYAVLDGAPHPTAPCLTSAGLLAENVALAQATYARYGEEFINVMPTDGYSRLCEHPGCAGLDTPQRGPQGKLSDYVWGYINSVAEQLYLTHPQIKVEGNAYTSYMLPPENISTFSPNVVVTICRWRTWMRDPATKTFYQNLTNDWLSRLPSGELYIWDYYLHSRANSTEWAGVPIYYPHLISEDLKFLKGKSKGEFIEVDRNDPSTDGWDAMAANHLNLYVTSRLWWDADQDIDALLDDYYTRFYGPAAAEMKAFVEYCEANWEVMHTPQGTAEVDHAMALLADAATAAGSGIYRDRVGLLETYTERLVTYRNLYRDRYVAQNGQTPVPPYTSWATAATNIQDAVDSAVEGNTIWVAPGTYTAPTTPVVHEGPNVVHSEKPLTLRSSSGNPLDTIIDGEGVNRGVSVRYIGNNAHKFVLDGFTIRNGMATKGGGVFINTGNWTWHSEILNCIIENNTATTGHGGGIGMQENYGATSTVRVEDCLISGNAASPTSGMGGGIYSYLGGGGLTVVNSLIEGNTAYMGAGIRMSVGTNRVENSRLSANHAVWFGGGVSSTGADTYRNVLFDNNLVDNSGRSKGGGALAFSSNTKDVELSNCTLADNAPDGLVIQTQGGSFAVMNTIISGTTPDVADYSSSSNPTTITYTHVLTTTAKSGTGNLTGNPLFDSPEYTLQSTSPAIDAGLDAPWMADALDLDGNDRLNGTVDIGAYEYW